MRISILTIGDELLRGKTVNTNAAFIGENLQQLGLIPQCCLTVPDRPDAIRQALDWLLPQSDLVITSGGLGSTGDDLTRDTVAAYCNLPLAPHPDAVSSIQTFLLRRGRHCHETEKVMRQALAPAGSELLPNLCGTAPGLWIAVPGQNRHICMLPGPPAELHPMVTGHLIPRLAQMGAEKRHTRLYLVAHAPELWVEETMEQLRRPDDQVSLAYCASYDHVKLFLSGPDAARLDDLCRRTEAAFGSRLLRSGGASMAEDLIALLREKHLTLATAESCTGGLIAAEITAVPGSSDVFAGSAVTYSNRIKHEQLGVPESIFADHGAVSAECVTAMVTNLCLRFGTETGIAVSGIAGPGGGTPEKPVGLVYIAVRAGGRTTVCECRFPGDRESVRRRTVAEAIFELRQLILESTAD